MTDKPEQLPKFSDPEWQEKQREGAAFALVEQLLDLVDDFRKENALLRAKLAAFQSSVGEDVLCKGCNHFRDVELISRKDGRCLWCRLEKTR